MTFSFVLRHYGTKCSMDLSCGKHAVYFRNLVGEFLHIINKGILGFTVHMGQIGLYIVSIVIQKEWRIHC